MNRTDSDLQKRLIQLEKRNRILFVLWIGVIVFFVISFTFKQGTEEKIIAANRFQLTDSSGIVRLELAFRKGDPGLFLKDEQGRDRLMLVHDNDQTALYILDSTNTVRVGASQFSHGGGGFALHGPAAKGAAVLYLKNNGSLSFYDADGNAQLRIPAQ